MKTITIGRADCDIIIPDSSISRKHASISLVNGRYVYTDMSKNGTTINGQVYQNEKVVVVPGTPVYLSNKVPLPWTQVLMLLPNSPLQVNRQQHKNKKEVAIERQATNIESSATIGIGCGIASFLFPIIGFVLYFVWKDTAYYKAKQAANIAWISVAINLVIIFISGLLIY